RHRPTRAHPHCLLRSEPRPRQHRERPRRRQRQRRLRQDHEPLPEHPPPDQRGELPYHAPVRRDRLLRLLHPEPVPRLRGRHRPRRTPRHLPPALTLPLPPPCTASTKEAPSGTASCTSRRSGTSAISTSLRG